jgi:heme/copper-type cytochrome/quinol oxidase subunit 4
MWLGMSSSALDRDCFKAAMQISLSNLNSFLLAWILSIILTIINLLLHGWTTEGDALREVGCCGQLKVKVMAIFSLGNKLVATNARGNNKY